MKSEIAIIIIVMFFLYHTRLSFGLSSSKPLAKCPFLRGCKEAPFNVIDCLRCTHVSSSYPYPGFECDARENIGSNLDNSKSWNRTHAKMGLCQVYEGARQSVHMRFPRSQRYTLSTSFNMKNFFSFVIVYGGQHNLRFSNINGFEIDLNIRSSFNWRLLNSGWNGLFFDLVNTRFDFYSASRLIRSCQDLDENKTVIDSFLQIPHLEKLIIRNCEYRRPVCPLVFKNSNLYLLRISAMSDYFYKQNYLRFTPLETNNGTKISLFKSIVREMDLLRIENIRLDATTFPALVFKDVFKINIYGSVRRIDADLFRSFPKLTWFRLERPYYLRLVHDQGIEWMRSINHNLTLDLANRTQLNENFTRLSMIVIGFEPYLTIEDSFPDKDFCLYANFPFEQLVAFRLDLNLISPTSLIPNSYDPDDWLHKRPTCTFHWLSRHFLLLTSNKNPHNYSRLKPKFDKIQSECDFLKRLVMCKKSNFRIEPAKWDQHDWKRFVNVIRLLLDVSIYPICLFGMLTNLIIIYIISTKNNNEIFKGFRQYTFLKAISVFNMAILAIQILSWMSECTDTLDLFCPLTRKLVAVQFFKVIFKEFFVVAFRFMSNFSYLAFALNRISLIGQDHIQLVEYMTRVKMRKFFLATGFISSSLSLVKAFRYQVNYDRPDNQYPTSLEGDFSSRPFDLAISSYFVANVVSDFLNYLVFLGINLGIDIYMLFRLRRTLIEKVNRFSIKTLFENLILIQSKESINKEKAAKKTLKNAIKMVVFNSALNIVFKLPLLIMPLLNVIAAFYYHSDAFKKERDLNFSIEYQWLEDTGFVSLVNDLSEWFYVLFISIQLFFYIRFDKKIKSAWTSFVRISKAKQSSPEESKSINQ